ncbi:DNA polymerase III subunit gamma/tau [Deinococcus radiopugnans]|uniref:DNA polymerase III subunit gamma/tau n=3 Tax=Deinococcus radiopugnans TaxID=57497 RepID=A0ABR6NQZ6_9DEIO|nr:DNA polymerase III subunit gamma/tau [Deinococcus radiopugnans]MBB6016447.1 DNA polymerase-3 subunit gamma/tau [Deinococcus radiopugnans ATCC 19172]
MSAIYQRARPIRWDQVVGQEHVKDVLKAALEAGRVGHAYLFSGPRGVGKTTTARLIAMTANCTGPAPKPCGECDSCLSVRAGSHPDVMEIDAASNNSVDDVRDLRELVGLAAMRGGKKIYILDEAHMMSRAAFNALLKTLEEPPGHVIFILATTEPEKIIPTILSRCQHYRFRRLTPEEIAGKLAGLATQEGMTAEPEALNLIGRLADGAMRDGESLLERMLAAGSAVTRAGVEEALGLPPGERVRAVAAALVTGDVGAALQGAGRLYRDGFAARTVVEGLVSALGAALHAELGLDDEGRLDGADVPRLLKLQAALDGQEARFARSADGQSLELALTHALLAADGGGAGSGTGGPRERPSGDRGAGGHAAAIPADLLQRLNRMEKELAGLRAGGGAAAPQDRRGPAPAREPVREAVAAIQEDSQAHGEAHPPQQDAAPQGNWADVVRAASMQLRAFLKPARMHAEAGYVSLIYDDKNAFHAKQALNKFDDISALALRVFGPVTFELITAEATKKQKLGGGTVPQGTAPALQPAPIPRSAPAQAAPSPQASAEAAAGIEIAPFDPTPRRASRTAEGPGPQAGASPSPQATPPQSGLPPRPAAVATLDPPGSVPPPRPQTRPPETPVTETRLPRPASPDDVAPAPLPTIDADPWQAEHVAAAPPPPAGAAPPEARTAARELYVVEPIDVEPDWDDIGGPLDAAGPAGPPDLDDAPYASLAVERPAPAPRSAAPPVQPASAAPSRPGDIRAHPMYEEIKGRFSGRVREIGKNRNPVAPATEGETEDEDAEA